jgi:hypothetical protein
MDPQQFNIMANKFQSVLDAQAGQAHLRFEQVCL